jgi:hypothetical protein
MDMDIDVAFEPKGRERIQIFLVGWIWKICGFLSGLILNGPKFEMQIYKNALPGTEMILAERERQINQEGYTAEHDDRHEVGELGLAAISYIWNEWIPNSQILKMYWPWDPESWKPKDRIANLAKAGALIAAEIDRLKRIEAKKGE